MSAAAAILSTWAASGSGPDNPHAARDSNFVVAAKSGGAGGSMGLAIASLMNGGKCLLTSAIRYRWST
jgi:hypothetical protein